MKINDIRKTDIGIMKYVVGQTFESYGNVYLVVKSSVNKTYSIVNLADNNILSEANSLEELYEKYSYGGDTQINAEITIKDGDD